MRVLKPLTAHVYLRGLKRIFLAGSIEQGTAENWQLKVEQALSPWEGYLLNPRRDDWDPTWIQDKDNVNFYRQVSWELEGLEASHLVLMYFDPTTKSPITMLELGLLADKHKLFVACPYGFERRGNVQIVVARYGIPFGDSLDWLINSAMGWLNSPEVANAL